ncbi:MAG: cardiolipin synthase ClsB [Planctomycetes bacterium]|nr:cardiolipin synthase ClsB [Planctomycetota bacterium]
MTIRSLFSLKRGVRTRGRIAHAEDRYVRMPELLSGGNRVTLLRRGAAAYPAMLAEIAAARHQVHLETYILRSDVIGRRFQAALIERADAGVKVRLMFDSVGSFGLVEDDFLAELAHHGVEIVEYHPILPFRRRLIVRLRALRQAAERRMHRPERELHPREPGHWSINNRDHQKLLIVDDRVAFTGGINIGAEYAPPPEGGDWHDLHVRVEGPAAVGLARIFQRAWLRGGGERFPEPREPHSNRDAPMRVHTCDNFGLRNRSRMHSSYRHAIRAAEHSVCIMNAYFIPDQLLIWALTKAARNGVSVRVMVPAKSDVRLVYHASRYVFGRLLRAGVRIFEYQERMMHAKAAAIDTAWATIGSFNLDRRSMLHNLEAGLVILDHGFGASLEQHFDAELERCREITLAEWEARPWSAWFKSWFAHLFAYWL